MALARLLFCFTFCLPFFAICVGARSYAGLNYGDPGTSQFSAELLHVWPASGIPSICQRAPGRQQIRCDDNLELALTVNNVSYRAILSPDDSILDKEVHLQSLEKWGLDIHSMPSIHKGILARNDRTVGEISTVFGDDGMDGNCRGRALSFQAIFNIHDTHYIIHPRGTTGRRAQPFPSSSDHASSVGIGAAEVETIAAIPQSKSGNELDDQTKLHGMRLVRRNLVAKSQISDFEQFDLVLILDETYLQDFTDLKIMFSYTAQMVAVVSNIYKDNFDFTVKIAQVFLPCDFYGEDFVSGRKGISEFEPLIKKLAKYWDRTKKKFGHAVHLLTNKYDGNTLGLAFVAAFCKYSASPMSISRLIKASGKNDVFAHGRVLAHELGHTLGSSHDDENGLPSYKKKYIMYSTSTSAMDFSPESKRVITEKIQASKKESEKFPRGLCVGEKYQLVASCGNGIIDSGEECDASGLASDPCCDLDCKFKAPTYNCTPRNNGKCCNNCVLSPKGTVCRPSTGFCDLVETCDVAGLCPADIYRENGEPCTIDVAGTPNPKGLCAVGICTNRHHQCFLHDPQSTSCGSMIGKCDLKCSRPAQKCENKNLSVIEGTMCGVTSFCASKSCTWDGFPTLWRQIQEHSFSVRPMLVLLSCMIVLMTTLLILRRFYGPIAEQKYEELIANNFFKRKIAHIRRRRKRILTAAAATATSSHAASAH